MKFQNYRENEIISEIIEMKLHVFYIIIYTLGFLRKLKFNIELTMNFKVPKQR